MIPLFIHSGNIPEQRSGLGSGPGAQESKLKGPVLEELPGPQVVGRRRRRGVGRAACVHTRLCVT